MAYSKTNWVNNTTPINETNLNKIEQGIYDNSLVVDAITNTLNPTDTETYKTAELTEGQITDVIGVNDILIKGQTSQNGEPTPDTPQEIHCVKGNNAVKVSGKNILDSSKISTGTKNGITLSYDKDTQIFTINGSCTQDNTVFELNNNYNIYANKSKLCGYYVSGSINGYFTIRLFEGNYRLNITLNLNELTNTNNFIKGTNTYSFLSKGYASSLRCNKGTTANNFKFKLMLTDSDDTEWEPYQGSTYPLSLGNIELCQIGDYQDYFYKDSGNWYLHKEIEKIVISGNENWGSVSSIGGHYRYGYQYDKRSASNDTLLCYCNYFKGVAKNKIANENDISANLAWITILTSISTLNDFKSMLQTKMPILYRVLATPIEEEITDTTLISQLEAIYNAPLYEQTNITQTNNDLPMVLDITACKDNINGIKAFIRKER